MAHPTPLSARDRHLADRVAYGVHDDLVRDVHAAGGGRAWFERQLARSEPETLAANLVDTWFPLLANPPGTTAALVFSGVRGTYQIGQEIIARSFARRILSRHQLHETMADFWSNLLYVPASEDRSFAWRADYDDTIRARALGTYRGLLRAAIVHPSMAGFLTNDLNATGALNENLGRELLELHTVGRVYAERDVVDAARLLTGFTVNVFTDFEARYDPARHDTGPVRVLDFRHPNADPDGRRALDALLDHLARHPATARRLAQRLCLRFVGDEPTPAHVAAVARAYRRADTAIGPTLRALVEHPDFARSRGLKTWTPSDDVVRTARVLGLTPQGAATPDAFVYRLVGIAQDMGQVSLRWPRPDGWPETSADYLSAARVLRSWQHHHDLAGVGGDLLTQTAQSVGVPAKASQLPDRWPQTLAELVDHQSRRLVARPASAALVRAVAAATGVAARHRFRDAAAVPDAVYAMLRGTVLTSPAGLQR